MEILVIPESNVNNKNTLTFLHIKRFFQQRLRYFTCRLLNYHQIYYWHCYFNTELGWILYTNLLKRLEPRKYFCVLYYMYLCHNVSLWMIILLSLYDEVRQEAKTMSFRNLTITRDDKASLSNAISSRRGKFH